MIKLALGEFEAVLEQQDEQLLEQARENLSKFLDQFEGDLFF
jgi:hypothetical protein